MTSLQRHKLSYRSHATERGFCCSLIKSNQYQEEPEEVANPYEDLTDIPPDDESNIVYDFYIDRPPTAQYKPKERGIDVATQIEHFEPELFDFILEVEPVLQVIVGKTIEQARMELIEEEENETLRQHKVGQFYEYVRQPSKRNARQS